MQGQQRTPLFLLLATHQARHHSLTTQQNTSSAQAMCYAVRQIDWGERCREKREWVSVCVKEREREGASEDNLKSFEMFCLPKLSHQSACTRGLMQSQWLWAESSRIICSNLLFSIWHWEADKGSWGGGRWRRGAVDYWSVECNWFWTGVEEGDG